jgi:hypothetical protein
MAAETNLTPTPVPVVIVEVKVETPPPAVSQVSPYVDAVQTAVLKEEKKT